jgi:hypothetical protein
MRRLAISVAALLSGTVFGIGLSLSTMIRPEVVLDFLLFRDMGLLLVMAGAVTVTLLIYQVVPRVLRQPLLGAGFDQRRVAWNRRTLVGAALFGAGWGLCGVCPGPAIAGLGAGNWPILLALAGIFAGAYVQGRWFSGR